MHETRTEYVEFHVQCKPLSDDESFMTTTNSIRIPNLLIHVHVILNSCTCKLIRQRLMYEVYTPCIYNVYIFIFLCRIHILMQLSYMYVVPGPA